MRIGRLELTLREREPREAGRIRRVGRWAATVTAVLLVVGLPGSQLAMRMAGGDDGDGQDEPLDDFLDAEAAEFVEANWERAIGIDDVFVEDDLALEDEAMEPLASALSVEGIPDRALEAYLLGEDNLAVDDPGCGLRWSLLAAIAEVESGHGQAQGADLLENGDTTKPIRGIPLDGGPGVARIPDTDNGRIDGDPTIDRASGPFQFIPSTWVNVAVDANGDDVENVDNIDDAATGAGAYLCSGDRDLRNEEDLDAAIFSYNRSREYVRTVKALAEMYEEGGVDDLAFEDDEFADDLGPEIDDATGFEGELGPEIEEPDVEAPAAEEPAPPAPAEVPTLPAAPPTPGSVGWPTGMDELPSEHLPPPIPLPGETTTTTVPPTTAPPTTVPEDDCPTDPAAATDDADDTASTEAPTSSSTTVPPSTVPSTTTPPPADSTTTTASPIDDCATSQDADAA